MLGVCIFSNLLETDWGKLVETLKVGFFLKINVQNYLNYISYEHYKNKKNINIYIYIFLFLHIRYLALSNYIKYLSLTVGNLLYKSTTNTWSFISKILPTFVIPLIVHTTSRSFLQVTLNFTASFSASIIFQLQLHRL